MVNTILPIKVERGRVVEVAETLAGVNGVSEVYSVAGRCDLVAMLRVRHPLAADAPEHLLAQLFDPVGNWRFKRHDDANQRFSA
jgi:DNA-binding Lrp family transcriptional regulator